MVRLILLINLKVSFSKNELHMALPYCLLKETASVTAQQLEKITLVWLGKVHTLLPFSDPLQSHPMGLLLPSSLTCK